MQKIELTDEEVTFLRENIGKLTYKELGKRLNMSSTTVIKRCGEMNISNKKGSLREHGAGFYEDRIKDYDLYKLRIKKIITKCKSGKLGNYEVIKMYKDKVLMADKKGYRVCLTYQELALKGDK